MYRAQLGGDSEVPIGKCNRDDDEGLHCWQCRVQN